MNTIQTSQILVIMAGGAGTRFWPKSTHENPKQFLKIGPESKRTGLSLLQLTRERFKDVKDLIPDETWVVTTEKLSSLVTSQLGNKVKILSEPIGKNTAPCIFWACKKATESGADPVLWVLPADHYIADRTSFLASIRTATEYAKSSKHLVTLGIVPTRAETGYGYLETSKLKNQTKATNILKVKSFREKPNRETAENYISSGRYYWNGGMFVFRASVMLQAFNDYAPQFEALWAEVKGDYQAFYDRVEAISIDYCIFEKTNNIMMVELNAGWDDLGAWTSLEAIEKSLVPEHKSHDNLVESGELSALYSTGNIVDVGDRVSLALLGVHDLIIAKTGDQILIAHKSRAQEIKKLIPSSGV